MNAGRWFLHEEHEEVMTGYDEPRLARLALDLQKAPDEGSTAQTVVDRALDFLPGADWVSLTVRRRRKLVTLAASSDEARSADEQQYELNQGPCVDSTQGVEWIRSLDVAADARWPVWGPRAAAKGVGSVLSLRLLSGDAAFGALNLYARRGGSFKDPDEVDLALTYATHAAVAMTSTLREQGFAVALRSRHQIGVAQGILMKTYGLDVEASFALLVRYSSTLNMKVATLAERIVETGELPAAAAD